MMKNKFTFNLLDVVILLLGIIPIVLAFKFLPDPVIRHSSSGDVSLINREYYLLGIGVINFGIALLIKLIPSIDPKRENYSKFHSTLEYGRLLLSIFLSVICCLAVLIASGHHFNLHAWFIFLFGLISILLGNSYGRVRSSYFVGLQTPWTLKSEDNWRRTHRFLGFISILTGFLALAALFFTNSLLVIYIAIAIQLILPTGYSYFLHKRKINIGLPLPGDDSKT